jgi:hypothetical protein
VTQIEKLLSIASAPLAQRPPDEPEWILRSPLAPELFSMLNHKNGFYAFESALHVLPHSLTPLEGIMDLDQWNSDSLWREVYGDLAKDLLFFAEDVFQDQFCLFQGGVLRFKAETGEREFVATSLQEWAGIILLDYGYQTGWTLASKWQVENAPLTIGQRLMPKTPFFLGGEYSVENLWAGNAVEGMRFKADLAMQTRNLADGTKVAIIVGDKPRLI